LTLAKQFDVSINEDEVYGNMDFNYPRPRTIDSFDEDGRVLLCSEFCKTRAAGLRIARVAPGRYGGQVLHMKNQGSGTTPHQP
ncbi:PLP-dependent aminotransferase family protein, partial [Pseudomonas syringae pv. tagetis]